MVRWIELGYHCVVVLAGCGGGEATPAPVDVGGGETQAGTVLDTSYPNGLDVGGRLALGTIYLEESELAVSPQQVTALLSLWQAMRGGHCEVVRRRTPSWRRSRG